MKNKKVFSIFIIGVIVLSFNLLTFAQTDKLLKRTTYKTETLEFGAGGTISITGAPNGSIEIEGWRKNEVEISAEIEVQAANEADLVKIASVTGYTVDAGFSQIRIYSVGTHDKKYLKQVAKKFPKELRGLPFSISYKIKVPAYVDLNIDGGNNDLNLSNVEGAMRINILETNAKLNLIGGNISAAFGRGNVDVTIPSQSWRGSKVDIQLVQGEMNVQLNNNLNAEVDAKVMRTGEIENTFEDFKERDRTQFTNKLILAKAGNGGASLSFMVGDGKLKIDKIVIAR